ncbi:MAG: DUF3187 family protein [Desulfobacteraceae bacterium]|nr:DUF3187 family protein [Desulfobacteraceae bacterium]
MIVKTIRHGRVVALFLLWIASPAWTDVGPISTQNHFPLFMLFLTPRPTNAMIPAQGEFEMRAALNYSRISMYDHSDQWSVAQDMEMTVVDLCLKYGLASRVALRLDIPIVSMNSGFLDRYVNGYHESIDVPTYGPDNVFAYRVRKEGQLWIEGESGVFKMTDITLSGQWQWLRPASSSGWSGSVLTSLKLPTGEVENGYGSGRLDWGLFAPTQWSGAAWSFYLMPGVIWPGNPDSPGPSIGARTSVSFFAGAAYQYCEKWQWLLQGNFFSSPLEKTGISKIDDGAFEMTLGARYAASTKLSWELALSEDLFTIAAPDFTVHLGLVWTWRVADP